MPIYEYRCEQCKRRNAFNVRGFNPPEAPTCQFCGHAPLKRIFSRVAVMKSEESRLEALSDPTSFGGVDENDPKSMARFMRKMAGEMGDEAGEAMPPEFDEVVDRLEAGESPEAIEQTMGDVLGGGASPEPDL
jgi:putative FmdB family regulatory protein